VNGPKLLFNAIMIREISREFFENILCRAMSRYYISPGLPAPLIRGPMGRVIYKFELKGMGVAWRMDVSRNWDRPDTFKVIWSNAEKVGRPDGIQIVFSSDVVPTSMDIAVIDPIMDYAKLVSDTISTGKAIHRRRPPAIIDKLEKAPHFHKNENMESQWTGPIGVFGDVFPSFTDQNVRAWLDRRR